MAVLHLFYCSKKFRYQEFGLSNISVIKDLSHIKDLNLQNWVISGLRYNIIELARIIIKDLGYPGFEL